VLAMAHLHGRGAYGGLGTVYCAAGGLAIEGKRMMFVCLFGILVFVCFVFFLSMHAYACMHAWCAHAQTVRSLSFLLCFVTLSLPHMHMRITPTHARMHVRI
jgi:hypothetical protein